MQDGGKLTWPLLSLAANKHYTFKIKLAVDACAPDALQFDAGLKSGACETVAASLITTVKRAKGAEPCPTGACDVTNYTTDGKPVYNCGTSNFW